jgi:hypothetical protein
LPWGAPPNPPDEEHNVGCPAMHVDVMRGPFWIMKGAFQFVDAFLVRITKYFETPLPNMARLEFCFQLGEGVRQGRCLCEVRIVQLK